MRVKFQRHPDTPCGAVEKIEADIVRAREHGVILRCEIYGEPNALRLPEPAAPLRADELWKHTCLELFVRGPDEHYFEFNFAPSTQWAAYRFDRYRAGMRNADAEPKIDLYRYPRSIVLIASVGAPDLPLDATWRAGLSAVIEEASGAKSYWALAHPPGAPDFHHSDCFALELRPPETP